MAQELAALLERLRMAVDRFNGVEGGRAVDQHAVVDRDRHFAHDRQTGMLQQVVDVVNAAGAGVFNRHHGVVSLAGLDLIKDIGKFQAAAFDELLKVAGGILAGRQMRVGTFRAQKRDTCGVRVNFIQVLLEQGLLGQD